MLCLCPISIKLSLAVTQRHHGGHQEENAGHEGREGQLDGPMRCLRTGKII